MATIATSATLSMSKPRSNQAEVRVGHCNAARTANHGSGETREAAERQRRQAPDQAAESDQRAHNMMTVHACCYDNCSEAGLFQIGANGGDSHWICWRHLNRWNQTRACFLADGGGCAMQSLGELLD